MDRIWSPWRRAYVTDGARDPGCVLCRSRERAAEVDSLVVHGAARNFIVMNLSPYNAGHVMIAPARHLGSLTEASQEELSEMMALARRWRPARACGSASRREARARPARRRPGPAGRARH